MKKNKKVYSLRHKKSGKAVGTRRQSGYLMFLVRFIDNTECLCYPEELIDLDREYSNEEVWRLAKILPVDTIIENRHGARLVFTGELFLPASDYVGMSRGDMWKIVKIC